MSSNTMLYALYRMAYHGRATTHGFRGVASTILNESNLFKDGSRAGSKQIGDFTKAFVDAVYAKLLVVESIDADGNVVRRERRRMAIAAMGAVLEPSPELLLFFGDYLIVPIMYSILVVLFEGERINSELCDRLVGAGVWFVVENVHGAIANLHEVNV